MIGQQQKVTIEYNKHDYGMVLRSSGIFYFRNAPSFKTTISILNYWKLKRNLDVLVLASLRTMNGTLVRREILKFESGYVINYSPITKEEYFEGSVEIEVFSLEDMVIPYAGIMVIYESKNGVSMVHTYGRTYSNQEIEEGKVIARGEETCCNSFKNSDEIESFAIVHNGSREVPEQTVRISIVNHKGKRQETTFQLHKLNPYETVKFKPKDYFPNLPNFVEGERCYTSLSFTLNQSAFPRMISVNQKIDGSDFQVTHSNFAFSRHETSRLEEGKNAYMFIPRISKTFQEIIVYPDCDPGNYEVKSKSGNIVSFNEDIAVIVPINSDDSEILTFKKLNGRVPARIHTGVRILKSASRLASETCVGAYHDAAPPKRFFWGTCACNSRLNSQIFLQQFTWGDNQNVESPVIIKFYSQISNDAREIHIDPSEIKDGKYISDLLPDANKFFGDYFGWFTLFSPFPHCMAFSTLENNFGSISFEHTM